MLNYDDIETLIEALDALESKHMRDGLMGSMFSMMLIDDKEKARAEADKDMKKAEEKTRSIRDKIILLKAKLIQMRDKATIDEVITYLKDEE